MYNDLTTTPADPTYNAGAREPGGGKQGALKYFSARNSHTENKGFGVFLQICELYLITHFDQDKLNPVLQNAIQ